MDYKLIAFDLDGTLLSRNGHISECNKKALLRAVSKGIHVCICTGRALWTIPEDILSFPGIEYVISNNGASVSSLRDKKKINGLYLSPLAVSNIIRSTKDMNVTYEAFVGGCAYASIEYYNDPVGHGATPQAFEYIRHTRKPVEDIFEFIKLHENELESLDVIVGDYDEKAHVYEVVKGCTDEVYITSSVRQLLEISNKDGGKGTGLRFLSEYLDIPRQNVVAFGDADNDIDMMRFVGTGIAMANATDNLKQYVDYVTIHHDDDGVAYAFENILHI